eukprot:CAMPEP_0172539934 /NCGR_PEP_ID=MMETSP1067-20121228/11037_1 /TAXON_ID=265564 ORGANISM="Thalassiosira punctigera, Strain Tpunct2005C2" /NCGR_SAMPLE_ID=MMETSP1067 /ASSEMBLY_ACC=CAM_ASM_000444 /LENGTH=185 /DNA_ID=CAMNT_0013325695 /DNA_START=131 /DNA_END=688 /DNA_ORIENTATION=+
MSSSLVLPAVAKAPFRPRRIDHIVLRAKDTQRMLNFYVGVLGAKPHTLANGDSSVGRLGGALTHLRIGTSLIDLQSYDVPMGRKIHAGGFGLAEDEPIPAFDTHNGTLDHFAINMDPFEPKAVVEYLNDQGHPPFAEGIRYGADGDGYSIYLKDPENNVVELKCGSPLKDPENNEVELKCGSPLE